MKLHRCKNEWVKFTGHPCWRVEKALMDAGVEYEIAPHPWPMNRPEDLKEHTGQSKYPAIEFEDGSWYRDESKEMEKAIREGRLDRMRGKTPAAGASA